MGFEIDFLAIGEGKKGGDEITIRIWDEGGSGEGRPKVIVIDGGLGDSGRNLVDHVKKEYGTEHVDFIFLTRPQARHSAWLATVLAELEVDYLLLNRSSLDDLETPERPPDWPAADVQRRLGADLHSLAREKGVQVLEPNSDDFVDRAAPLIVLSLSLEYYDILLPAFRGVAELQAARTTFETWLGCLSAATRRLKVAGPAGCTFSPPLPTGQGAIPA